MSGDTSEQFTSTELKLIQEDIDIPLVYKYNPKNWDNSWPSEKEATQMAQIRLRVVVSKISTADDLPQHNGVWVRFFEEHTLGGTAIIANLDPHPLINDKHKGRGWYLESATIKASVRGPGVKFQGSSPNTKAQSGSVSSSSGFNVSGGFFADSPMATVGYNQNKSASYTYNDVTFYDQDTTQLAHRYAMTGTTGSNSSSYSDHKDLVWSEPFSKAEVRTPPADCFNPGNMPIISQAFWTVPIEFDGILPISITIDTKWILKVIQDTDLIGDYNSHWWSKTRPKTRQINLNWFEETLTTGELNRDEEKWLKDKKNSGASVVAMAHRLAGTPLKMYVYRGSSKTPIWSAYADAKAAPWDHSDFGRCYDFLKKFPGYKSNLDDLRTLSQVWDNLVNKWTEISNDYAKNQMKKVDNLVRAAHQ